MTADEKLRMARQLDRLDVDVIEAGFPISSEAISTLYSLWTARFAGP